jgi:hypothetical protein
MSLVYRLSDSHTDSPPVRSKNSSGSKKRARLFGRRGRRSPLSKVSVSVRRDGAVAVKRDNGPEDADHDRTPVIFEFEAAATAEAVMAGALRRLAVERMDENKRWYLDISAGQAAAAIKAEAKGLSCPFAIIHPYLMDAPTVGSGGRVWATRAAGLLTYAIVMSVGALIGLVVGLMLKGS